ncbi:MAG: hypothetical protein FJ308_13020 [Planctomycetes bacterium]|nr:hypothetical protein [Planctomycetota bacterium]
MAHVENPNQPPLDSSCHTAHDRRDSWSQRTAVVLVISPALGGLIGFLGFIAASIFIELQSQPTEVALSYGQEAGLFSLPLCTVVGAATGFSVAISIMHRHLIAISMLIAVGVLGSGVVASMWSGQISRYGRDPSEVVLYYVPMAACGGAFVIDWLHCLCNSHSTTT